LFLQVRFVLEGRQGQYNRFLWDLWARVHLCLHKSLLDRLVLMDLSGPGRLLCLLGLVLAEVCSQPLLIEVRVFVELRDGRSGCKYPLRKVVLR
jgi:hypothetical protein